MRGQEIWHATGLELVPEFVLLRPRNAKDDLGPLGDQRLSDGLGTGEIAGRLYLRESTAKTHITHIYQKLGAANRAQALVTAMRMGLLDGVASGHLTR